MSLILRILPFHLYWIQPVIYKNDSLVVYKIKNETVNNFITLNEGWYTVENWSGLPGRWINSNATLSVYSDQDRQATLIIKYY